eukprot:scaffold638_cov168-Amphora_coffeaeformis.AAC.9
MSRNNHPLVTKPSSKACGVSSPTTRGQLPATTPKQTSSSPWSTSNAGCQLECRPPLHPNSQKNRCSNKKQKRHDNNTGSSLYPPRKPRRQPQRRHSTNKRHGSSLGNKLPFSLSQNHHHRRYIVVPPRPGFAPLFANDSCSSTGHDNSNMNGKVSWNYILPPVETGENSSFWSNNNKNNDSLSPATGFASWQSRLPATRDGSPADSFEGWSCTPASTGSTKRPVEDLYDGLPFLFERRTRQRAANTTGGGGIHESSFSSENSGAVTPNYLFPSEQEFVSSFLCAKEP